MASASSIMVEVSCALVICMIAFAPNMIHVADADISCLTVDIYCLDCLGFVQGKVPALSPQSPCCNGLKALISQANTTADRQKTCSCLKSAASEFGAQEANAKALPGMCHLTTPYTIDPTVNCSTIN